MKGKVKWYNPKVGYGFITTEDGVDYFVHQSDIMIDGYRKLKENATVTFEEGTDDKGRTIATKVVPEQEKNV